MAFERIFRKVSSQDRRRDREDTVAKATLQQLYNDLKVAMRDSGWMRDTDFETTSNREIVEEALDNLEFFKEVLVDFFKVFYINGNGSMLFSHAHTGGLFVDTEDNIVLINSTRFGVKFGNYRGDSDEVDDMRMTDATYIYTLLTGPLKGQQFDSMDRPLWTPARSSETGEA